MNKFFTHITVKNNHNRFLFLLVFTLAVNAFAQDSLVIQRNKINPKDRWDLKDLYPSDSLWRAEFKWVEDHLDEFKPFEKNITQSANNLCSYLELYKNTDDKMSRITTYALCSYHEDMRDMRCARMYFRSIELLSKLNSAISFFEPNILTMNRDTLTSYIKLSECLQPYEHYFNEIFRLNTHTLIWEKEETMALVSPITAMPNKTYTLLVNSDFNAIMEQDTTHPTRIDLYKKHRYFIASLLNAEINIKRFYANIRNYNSSLEAALFSEKIPTAVYDTLITSITSNLQPLHNWIELKQKLCKVDSLTYSDALFKNSFKSDSNFTYDQSTEIILNATDILGSSYKFVMADIINNQWIDVYSTRGKNHLTRTYSVSGMHPYILFNWQNRTDAIYDLAGELGKAVNNYYSGISQAFVYSTPSAFLSYIPDYINKILVLNYLIDNAKTIKAKQFYIEQYINLIVSSCYHNTFLAQYERTLHAKASTGLQISESEFVNTFSNMAVDYAGKTIRVDEELKYMWAASPPLFSNFINFNFPIDFAIALQFTNNIQKNPEQGSLDYINFLKTGNSQYPIETLKQFNIDVTNSGYMQCVFNKLNSLTKELEILFNQVKLLKDN